MKGRKLGRRLRCALCDRERYELAGVLVRLEAPRAYPSYPGGSETVWLKPGDHVCGHHVMVYPQPPMPAGVA
jgi:hypothetical protein